MTNGISVAAITGANGYLGGVVKQRMQESGLRTVDLIRDPAGDYNRHFSLGGRLDPKLLQGIDILIHCAYDMSLRTRSDIWRINVDGTADLLNLALSCGIHRVIVLSSMSAYEGTKQLYGQSKLEIEALAREVEACSIRPGLVYGPKAGGMAGTLNRLVRLPIVPLVARNSCQFTIHEDDFAESVVALAVADRVPIDPIGIANPVPVSFESILEHFAREQGRTLRRLPINWRLVEKGFHLTEKLRIPLPVRADSLLGLVQPASTVPNLEFLHNLGLRFRRFGQPTLASAR